MVYQIITLVKPINRHLSVIDHDECESAPGGFTFAVGLNDEF
jgi:hypothetical protein